MTQEEILKAIQGKCKGLLRSFINENGLFHHKWDFDPSGTMVILVNEQLNLGLLISTAGEMCYSTDVMGGAIEYFGVHSAFGEMMTDFLRSKALCTGPEEPRLDCHKLP